MTEFFGGTLCPGCDGYHVFYMAGPMVWKFNGNIDRPTFEPSLLNWHDENKEKGIPLFRCHLNLTDGMLFYHQDCTHENKGKTFPLPESKY